MCLLATEEGVVEATGNTGPQSSFCMSTWMPHDSSAGTLGSFEATVRPHMQGCTPPHPHSATHTKPHDWARYFVNPQPSCMSAPQSGQRLGRRVHSWRRLRFASALPACPPRRACWAKKRKERPRFVTKPLFRGRSQNLASFGPSPPHQHRTHT